jgi:hypothetical protein
MRLWDWGLRQSARLPRWAQFTFCIFLAWPCVVVPRWRLFLGLSALTAAGLSAARWYYRIDDLDWGAIAALSTIHIWWPIVIPGTVLLPYTLLVGLMVLIADWRRRRRERGGAEHFYGL